MKAIYRTCAILAIAFVLTGCGGLKRGGATDPSDPAVDPATMPEGDASLMDPNVNK